MRHWVNFGLLFAFVTLAVTGVISFLQPFSLTTAGLHVWSAVATVLLVIWHLASRLRYFRSQFRWNTDDDLRPGRRVPKWGLGLLVCVWAGLVGWVLYGVPGAKILDWSYEARHRKEIVRAGEATGWWESPGQILVSRVNRAKYDSKETADLQLQVKLKPSVVGQRMPAIAIWTESTSGSLIETLYLSPQLAYSDQPVWLGKPVSRADVLPIWRHRYTLLTGQEPDGTVDAFTGATASHQFSLDDYLQLGDSRQFVICVELNQAGDVNARWPDPVLGQPSVLYTALVELDTDRKYWILQLTGRGEVNADLSAPAIHYDLEELSTAKELVELLLVRIAG